MCIFRKRAMPDADKDTLNLAYEMIVPAYDWSLRRIASVERRIDRLIALIVIVTVAFPVAVMASRGDEAISTSLLSVTLGSCALALAAFAVIFLLYTRRTGFVQYTLPSALTSDEWLSAPVSQFKKDVLEQAGRAIDENRALTNRRSWRTDWMTGVFGLEVLYGIFWAVTQYIE